MLAWFLGGFMAVPVVLAADQPTATEVEQVLAQAEDALAQAAERGHAWSVTRPLIDEARASLAAEDNAAALQRARRALVTAEAATAQAEQEQEAWRTRLPGA
jgi:hypothetical protein